MGGDPAGEKFNKKNRKKRLVRHYSVLRKFNEMRWTRNTPWKSCTGRILSVLLNCDKKDIPSITDASVIIVMDRSKADRYMNGLMLKTGNTGIRIQDLVTASYFRKKMNTIMAVMPEK